MSSPLKSGQRFAMLSSNTHLSLLPQRLPSEHRPFSMVSDLDGTTWKLRWNDMLYCIDSLLFYRSTRSARSRSWSRAGSLAFATAGNMVGLSVGGVIAMESGMKTVQHRLEGSGSELLYLMDRYSKATLKERMGDKSTEDVSLVNDQQTKALPRMIRTQDSDGSK
ncbi:MAG: hypothetical protein J3Q66DRAFT_336893 [Benniella sp.]|nr:MAG: hypothetical protein J3Q66DRAFT_336893 [Benniella sp.]